MKKTRLLVDVDSLRKFGELGLSFAIKTVEEFQKVHVRHIHVEKRISKWKLENHLMCGRTTGGQDDCIWDCEVAQTQSGQLIRNPLCLRDCFPEVMHCYCLNLFSHNDSFQASCFQILFDDFENSGVCDSPVFDNPFGWQTDSGCTIVNNDIQTGVCSPVMEAILQNSRVGCGFEFESQRNLIFDTIQTLLRQMCETANVNTFLDSISRPRVKRVVPIDGVEEFQGATLLTELNLGMVL